MALCSCHGGSAYISCSGNIYYGFGSHLCAWLRKEKITITNDKAFPAGALTELARKDAIEKSNIVIIIISKEYPSSKHCLDDFEMIMKYGEKKQILRVFYHIRSEDIISEFPEQMVKIWRNGFGEDAAKDAYKVNIDRDESEIVQDITRAVSSMMKCVCSLDAQGLNDAILQPTTTHRTSSMPVSRDLSKKKQIADVKVGKIPLKLRPQVGRQSEEPLENLVHAELPSKKIHQPELHRGQVTEEKMLSRYNQTASISSSFSDVNHDVDQQTLAKDSVPSQSSLKRIELEEGRRILVAEVDGRPEDLLTKIFKELRAVDDFVVCSIVCRGWRSACLNLKWSLYPHPWSIHFQGQNIMNHLDDGRYVLEKWKIDGRDYYGCVNGWILSIRSKRISIFNLFSRTQRNLPKLSPVGYLKEEIKNPIDWYSNIEKFILFKVSQGDCFQFLVVALFADRGFIAFTRSSGFRDWICIESDDIACCRDVVLFQEQFYALCGRGKLFLCVFDRYNPFVSLVSREPTGSFGAYKYYLVKNVDHLIAVFQYRVNRFDPVTFSIYRLDGTFRREPIDLEGRVLFISNGNSWIIDAAKVKSCIANSIYFEGEYWSNNRDGHLIVVFDIASGKTEDLFEMAQDPANNVSPILLTDNDGA